MNFKSLFSENNSDKSNYLARQLGIFSESIVGFWLANENCRFESLGRPSIHDKTGKKIALLDFTLKDKATGRYFIVEQKTLVAYKNGSLLHMCDDESFHKAFESFSKEKSTRTPAWKLFLGDLSEYTVKIKNEPLHDFGRILIWSKFDMASKIKIDSIELIDEVLCFEQIHKQLIEWQDDNYLTWLNERWSWTKELFSQLKGETAKQLA